MKKIFETNDMNKAAILATEDGINIGLLTVDLVDGKYLVTYRNEYPEGLQLIVDQMIKQYDDKVLTIDANKLCFRLSFLRFLHNKKVKEFQSRR